MKSFKEDFDADDLACIRWIFRMTRNYFVLEDAQDADFVTEKLIDLELRLLDLLKKQQAN